jgi:DNA-binding CsgD family transcriptional regulator
MNSQSKAIGVRGKRGLRPDSTLTSEEAIILRALIAGKTEKQVREDLRISGALFLRLMRDMRGKTGAPNNLSLLVWAQRWMESGDQRVARQEMVESLHTQ